MISIIISTHNSDNYCRCVESINNTIGVECEVLSLHNEGEYSLTDIYELKRKEAKYEYLLFLHEDTIFLQDEWGKNLINLMIQNPNIGIVGIVGGKYKTTLPSGWTTWPVLAQFSRGHLWSEHGHNDDGYFDFDICRKKDFEPQIIEDVVTVDGVFIFVREKVFETCHFDVDLLRGFHGYDTDFCLQAFTNGWRVVIDREIHIRHISRGRTDEKHELANRAISKKWRRYLPLSTKDLKMRRIDYIKWESKIYVHHYYYGYIRPFLKNTKHKLSNLFKCKDSN